MAATTKRLWKVQEFRAHSANVNCLALGHKSGRVLVTGGDDKKVNLWAIGKSNCIMSLSGHTSAVETVKFNHTEELVAAGSGGGVLKIWDLEQAQIVRTLTGHRGGLRAIDFHPYGDFLTSSSLDTTVKMWDTRRKGCIFTYKGHSQSVNSVKFSPDGLWIASGGEEGLVKLWDIRVGRVLHEFPNHSGPVTAVEFHPHEFLLTSASCDKTVNFYDLENFSVVSTCDKDSMSIRCVSFNATGDCLFGGGLDVLKVMAWEPGRTLELVPISWGRVQDITTGYSDNRLVGASFMLSNVSLWMVDLSRVAPLGETPTPAPPSPFSHGQSVRKSFTKKPSPEKSPIKVKTIEEVDKLETDPEDENHAEIPDIRDYRSVFQPRSTLNRSPPPSIAPPPVSDEDLSLPHMSPSAPPPSLMEPAVSPPKARSPPPPPQSPRRRAPSPSLTPPSLRPREPLRRLSSCKDPEIGSPPDNDYPVRLNTGLQHSPSDPSIASVRTPGHSRTNSMSSTRHHSQRNISSSSSNSNKTDIINSQNRVNNNNNVIANTPRPVKVEEDKDLDFIPMSLDKPSGLNMEEFLPQRLQQTFPEMSEAEVLSSIMRGHDYIVSILRTRERQLQIVYSMWHNKDLKTAVDHALTLRDLSVIVDLLGVITLRPGIWNLDLCVALLPAIGELLQSKFEMYMTVGGDALKLILHTFTPVIKSNVMNASPTCGVDISREERYKKCMKCYNSLVAIRTFLLKRQTMQGKLGHTFRELHILLQNLDAN
ncbi:katanin p80 WD40 repeat-containing subunit B1 [Macrosteles quadrilineatus]|uniref:katanin p80 WD40 repeat-containing subunit B1 n=1 Tax=Macrosteles quadrilineatus TaxID=74068 RepID=UPI0023E15E6A|nr:katanin p80 WD40 repeat-containing subunit B1 [Macrosteles quadrilineatus]